MDDIEKSIGDIIEICMHEHDFRDKECVDEVTKSIDVLLQKVIELDKASSRLGALYKGNDVSGRAAIAVLFKKIITTMSKRYNECLAMVQNFAESGSVIAAARSLPEYVDSDDRDWDQDVKEGAEILKVMQIRLPRIKSVLKGSTKITDIDKAGKDAACFVATAVYEDEMASDVVTLRELRDAVLHKSAVGRMFIGWYYRWGPILATLIGIHEWSKPPLRFIFAYALVPVVKFLNSIRWKQ